ncbi:MAG: hypothetical protein Q9198_007907, partial [Flavoplaca austrocitrina]
ALDEIKKLKMEMDAKVAAVEAAIRTQNQSTALTLANGLGQDTGRISENLQTTTRNFAFVPTFGEIGQLERTRTEAEGRARASKDNGRVAESTKQPQIGAVTASGAAQVAAGTSSKASIPRAIVNSTTRTNDHIDPTVPGLAAAPISGISSTTDQVALQTPVPEDIVQTNNAVVKQGPQGSAHPIGDQPMSGCDVNVSRSSIDQTAAASAVSGEPSQTTQKPIQVSNKTISRKQSSSCPSSQADLESGSCSEGSSSNYGTDVEDSDDVSREEESDDETGEEDSDESSSGDDEDTEMEETETSEQSGETDHPNTDPIRV